MDKEKILEKLNPEQASAVLQTKGPVLILAGAGSGKTRVLVHRIAYMIGECGVAPGNILAITFTNKAADEMRTRVRNFVGADSRAIWVMTFHACCVRILRSNAEKLGYGTSFTIYDSDDQLRLMKDIFKRRNIDPKMMKEKGVLGTISRAKDELITPEKFKTENHGDFRLEKVGSLYEEYQRNLREMSAMDFDDLICETVRLFREHPDVLAFYQERFKYLMVDEYQDTNTAQFEFVHLLSAKYRNLCVVGDDDQSIYKFRGANIKNILGFESVFKDAKVVRLEQNYRSTQTILDAANEVISNNQERKKKKLWTGNGVGEKVRLREFNNGFEEAEFVVGQISELVREGSCDYKDCAILYRTNAQSRMFEEKFLLANIPYQIVGGTNFYSRKEIKDVLAYMRTVGNSADGVSVKRIINIPKRGIGVASIQKIDDYAEEANLGFYEAALKISKGDLLGRSTSKIRGFTDFIEELRADSRKLSVSGLLKEIIDRTGYARELKTEDTETSLARIENIDELISKAVTYETNADTPSLSGFLEEVALIADIDKVSDSDDKVLLMTLHSAKGLEFDNVYMTGMEQGLFPGYLSLDSPDQSEIEEERRLCYVGITRAKEHLTLTCARQRMIRGDIQAFPVSQFVHEIPRNLVELGDGNRNTQSGRDKLLDRMGKLKNYDTGDGKYSHSGTGGDSSYSYGARSGRVSPSGDSHRTDAFAKMRDAFHARPYAPKPYAAKTQDTAANISGGLNYEVGDTVYHQRFGEGKVKAIASGGRDFEVTVDFDGTVKKMFASFANLKKVE